MEVSPVPSEHQGAVTDDRRERFPSLRDDLGEDPARFLDRPLFGSNPQTSGEGVFIRARIRGIDEIAVLRAWRAIERRLERGPREKVLGLLDERESELDEIGERPERLVYDHDAREPPSKDWVYVDDGERIPWDQWEQQRQIGVERLAADGGDSS